MYTSLELEEFWITLGSSSNGINRSNICFGFLLEKHRYTSFTLKHGREWLKLILEFLKELRIVELN